MKKNKDFADFDEIDNEDDYETTDEGDIPLDMEDELDNLQVCTHALNKAFTNDDASAFKESFNDLLSVVKDIKTKIDESKL